MKRLNSFSLLSFTLSLGCSTPEPPAAIPAATPGLELADESYADARGHFRTKLLRDGPASLLREPLVKPSGAVAVDYESAGRTLRAYASPIGPGMTPGPAILFLHGGISFNPAHWELTEAFRAAGYVALMPTLRGENGQAGTSSLFYDEVDDVLAAAAVLAARPDVDPTRVFLAGHSMGGTLTLLAALTSGRFRAAASFSAAPDLVEFIRNRPDRIIFDPADPAEFRMRSPVAFATQFRCPVRLYYGEDEFWLQGPTIRTALLAERAGLDVQAVELPGGHDSVTPASVAACLQFFAGVR